jgi:hypothetical protein
VLITGSRDWRNRDVIWGALNELVEGTGTDPTDVIVTHGECPTGADHDAYLWTLATGAKNDPHPANWRRYGKQAGPMRNRKMVKLGADICLAFSRICTDDRCDIIAVHGSHGCSHTVGLARLANIPTTLYKEGW